MKLEQMQKMNAITHETTLRGRLTNGWKHATGLFLSYEWLRTDAPVYFGDAMNGMIETQIKYESAQKLVEEYKEKINELQKKIIQLEANRTKEN